MRLLILNLFMFSLLATSTAVSADDRLEEAATRGELSAVILSDFFDEIRYVSFINGEFRIFYLGQGEEQQPEADAELPAIAERSCSPQRFTIQAQAGLENDPPGAGWLVSDYLGTRLGYSIDNVASILKVACVLPLQTAQQDETICLSQLYESNWDC